MSYDYFATGLSGRFFTLDSDIIGACSDPQPHPPTFFSNIMKILVPEVESYLEGFISEVAIQRVSGVPLP